MDENDDPDDLRTEEAKRLVEARIARGFTDAKAAAKYFGWKYNSYAQHENGLRGLKKAVAAKYALAYRVPVSWLQNGTWPSGASRHSSSGEETSDTPSWGTLRIEVRDEILLRSMARAAIHHAVAMLELDDPPDEKLIAIWAKSSADSFVALLDRRARQAITDGQTRIEFEGNKVEQASERGSNPR